MSFELIKNAPDKMRGVFVLDQKSLAREDLA